jgi:arylsulfatase A-like enzyme
VGHSFGPESHELQDTLLRLDRTLGALLTTLDRVVGRDRYVLGLSADHGVAMIPEAEQAAGRPGGRVPLGLVRSTVEQALAGLGPGPHVARAEYTQVYLTPDTAARATAETLAPAIAALNAMPGLRAAVWNRALDGPVEGVAPEVLDAIRGSYDRERSGDISIVPAPSWFLVLGSRPDGGDGTTHGSPNAYDQHVPLVFLGRPFPAGRYRDRASPADLAPTLAATIGLPMPGVEGRELTMTSSPRPR